MTLERARKVKELLKTNSGSLQEDESDISDTPMQDKQISQEPEEEAPVDLDISSSKTNKNIIQENPKEDCEEQDNSHISATKKNSISNPNSEKSKTPHQPQRGTKMSNPYLKSRKPTEQGILHAIPQRINNTKKSSPSGSLDKEITLKKGMLRPHIHRYTLRIKIIKSKSEEEEQMLVQKTLQKLFDIILQGNFKSIIPPYFELDRSDTLIPDLSSTFNVSALDSYYSLKRYFSRLSSRSEEGFVWSSIILAQSIPFTTFMEKTRHSLDNQAFSLWPKASDH